MSAIVVDVVYACLDGSDAQESRSPREARWRTDPGERLPWNSRKSIRRAQEFTGTGRRPVHTARPRSVGNLSAASDDRRKSAGARERKRAEGVRLIAGLPWRRAPGISPVRSARRPHSSARLARRRGDAPPDLVLCEALLALRQFLFLALRFADFCSDSFAAFA